MTLRNALVAFGALIAVAAIVFVAMDRRDPPAAVSAAGKHVSAPGNAQRLSPSSVLAIDVTQGSAPAATKAAKAAPHTLARDYEQARDLKPIYDRISAAPANGEEKYVLYRILSGCAQRTDKSLAPPGPPRADRRKELEASISDRNPLKATRLKAFDDLQRCGALSNLTTTQADLDKLLDDASRDGDPRARALQVQRELDGLTPRGAAAISDDQLGRLRASIASGDPAAIVIAGTVLSNTFSDLVIEVGDGQETLDPRASVQAWRLLACEYGLDCGSGNRELATACALQGRCGPTSIQDLIYFYETTPNQAQLVSQYADLFRRGIDTNDWSGLSFTRRNNRTQNIFRFGTAGP